MGYDLRPYNDLVLAKTNNKVRQHTAADGRLNLKGLIYSDTGELVAPGCTVPLEVPNTELPVDYYTKGRDGVQYRFYYHNGRWMSSTTGRIRPNIAWGPKGTPTFESLLKEATAQWDESVLNKKYCYYAVLESPNFTNLVKHEDLRLTLIDIVDCTTLAHINLASDLGFTHHELKHYDLENLENLQRDSDLRPLNTNDVGYVIHYQNGDIYKNETELYTKANVMKPNRPNPTEHWVRLYKTGGNSVTDYLCIFPWHKELFDVLHDKFSELWGQITAEYKDTCQYSWCRQYMLKLLQDFEEETSLTAEEAAGIFYMLNPHNDVFKQHSYPEGTMTM